MCGGWRNWITICVVRHDMALPLRSRNGTPCQRQLSMCSLTTPKVAVSLSGGTPGSSRYLRYWPRMRVGEHLLGLHGPDRPQHLDLLVADGVGLEPGGGLHGREGHQLQQVVLEHVAQDARPSRSRRPGARRSTSSAAVICTWSM